MQESRPQVSIGISVAVSDFKNPVSQPGSLSLGRPGTLGALSVGIGFLGVRGFLASRIALVSIIVGIIFTLLSLIP